MRSPFLRMGTQLAFPVPENGNPIRVPIPKNGNLTCVPHSQERGTHPILHFLVVYIYIGMLMHIFVILYNVVMRSPFLGTGTHPAFPFLRTRIRFAFPFLGTGTHLAFPFLGTERERDTPNPHLSQLM